LWLIKVWFSASTFVVKIATFAKPETVMGNLKKLQNGKQNNFRTYIEIYEIVDGN
jgi:hypothetical protein